MPSSVIHSYSYDDERRELAIAFKSGKRYTYVDVPREIFAALEQAPSKGDYFNTHVREQYSFVRDSGKL